MEVAALKYSGNGVLQGRSPLLRLQSDERLIALTRRGNVGAFEMLVTRYETRLLAFCRHMLSSREDAEDVMQEVMAAAFGAITADERPINARPWLYRIARNRCLNHLRRAQPIGVDSMDIHFGDNGASTADKVDDREAFRMLVDDIQDLPETQKTALVLRELEALSYEQIAEAMETTIPAVKSLLVRARTSLAEASEARLLSCEEVRIELAEVAEGLRKRPSPAVRRHVKSCEHCAVFEGEVHRTGRALAALLPVGPLALVRKLLFGKAALGAFSHGSSVAGGSVGASSATAGGSVAAGAAATAGTTVAAGTAVTAAGSSGLVTAGVSAIATKAVAGLAAAALVTAGAVEAGSGQRHAAATAGGAALAPAKLVQQRAVSAASNDVAVQVPANRSASTPPGSALAKLIAGKTTTDKLTTSTTTTPTTATSTTAITVTAPSTLQPTTDSSTATADTGGAGLTTGTTVSETATTTATIATATTPTTATTATTAVTTTAGSQSPTTTGSAASAATGGQPLSTLTGTTAADTTRTTSTTSATRTTSAVSTTSTTSTDGTTTSQSSVAGSAQ